MPLKLTNKEGVAKKSSAPPLTIRPQLFGSSLGLVMAWLWLGVALVGGCGARSMPMLPPQMAALGDSQTGPPRLQEQLLKQAAHFSVGDARNYRIGPEDLLEVSFLDTDKLRREVRVNGQGEISLLLVGPVAVAGLTPIEAEKKLARLYHEGDYLRNPQIMVTVKEYRHQKVAVTGAVNKPDHYALIGSRTLLEVLAMAGGLSDKAGEVAHIIHSSPAKAGGSQTSLTRTSFSPGTETIVVDLNRLLLQGMVKLNYPVQNGDVVHVPFAKTAHVLGAVAKPGPVLVKDNMTVTKAVAQTGGLHLALASNHATVLRVNDQGQREVIPVNLRQVTSGSEPDLPLRENDIVYVHEGPMRRFLYDFKLFMPGSFGMSIPAML